MKSVERMALASLIAEWEWSQTSSGTEAATQAACARRLRDAVDLTDDDILYARQTRIMDLMGVDENNLDFADVFDDLISEVGYQWVVDYVEHHKFEGLRAYVEGMM